MAVLALGVGGSAYLSGSIGGNSDTQSSVLEESENDDLLSLSDEPVSDSQSEQVSEVVVELAERNEVISERDQAREDLQEETTLIIPSEISMTPEVGGEAIVETQPSPEVNESDATETPAPVVDMVQNSAFICENDTSVASRAYVLLLGINSKDVDNARAWLESKVGNDPKNKGVMIFSHDAVKSLSVIGDDFVARFNAFVAEKKPDEVIIIGWSAGGTIAASTAHRLSIGGKGEIHTVASPLRGYALKGFLEALLEDSVGFSREIGVGFASFAEAPTNFRVYHHKTVKDSDLSGRCGGFAAFCDPMLIQANNLPNSKEFYYPQYDHEPIMHAVAEMVINCRK